MTSATMWNQITGEKREVPQATADHLVRNTYGEWSFKQPLPPGWDRKVPRYRVAVDLKPSAYARHRTEPPFSSVSNSAVRQYAERPVSAGEELELTVWPHASMTPLNERARQTLAYFTSHQKSRLPQAPWRNGRLHLDDGLTGMVPEALRPRLPTAGRSDHGPRRAVTAWASRSAGSCSTIAPWWRRFASALKCSSFRGSSWTG